MENLGLNHNKMAMRDNGYVIEWANDEGKIGANDEGRWHGKLLTFGWQ